VDVEQYHHFGTGTGTADSNIYFILFFKILHHLGLLLHHRLTCTDKITFNGFLNGPQLGIFCASDNTKLSAVRSL
jgi:hypothetical protein